MNYILKEKHRVKSLCSRPGRQNAGRVSSLQCHSLYQVRFLFGIKRLFQTNFFSPFLPFSGPYTLVFHPCPPFPTKMNPHDLIFGYINFSFWRLFLWQLSIVRCIHRFTNVTENNEIHVQIFHVHIKRLNISDYNAVFSPVRLWIFGYIFR